MSQAFLFFMHPSIRILSLVVFASALSQSAWLEIVISSFIFMFIYLFQPLAYVKKALAMTIRLKWLFLSIFLVYILFLPIDVQVAWLEGLLRIMILILIIFAVNLLLCLTSQESLIMGIYYISKPLELFGFRSDRLAVRMVLSLEYVKNIMSHRPKISAQGSPMQRLVHTGTYWVKQVEKNVEQNKLQTLEIDLVHPPLLQWSWPIVIAVPFAVL